MTSVHFRVLRGVPRVLRDMAGDRVLVLATMNRGKARELVELLGEVPFDVRVLSNYPDAVAPEETETTYRGNALLKARAAARLTGA